MQDMVKNVLKYPTRQKPTEAGRDFREDQPDDERDTV